MSQGETGRRRKEGKGRKSNKKGKDSKMDEQNSTVVPKKETTKQKASTFER